MNTAPTFALRRQRGVALIVLLALLGFVLVGALVTSASSSNPGFNPRDVQTMAVLREAKDGLIAYASGRDLLWSGNPACPAGEKDKNLVCPRPGSLPCPDFDNDGDADRPCDGAGVRVGRLPWRTLGLPDLRDSAGERLWYAVSYRFVEDPNSTCGNAGDAGCLNSNSTGTFTVRSSTSLVENNGTLTSGAAAVVLAPGTVLKRMDQAAPQDRSCTRGGGTDSTCQTNGACDTAGGTPWLTARCDPVNYLDVAQAPQLPVAGATSSKEDNATFIEGGTGDGFIRGAMLDSTGATRLNDVVLAVTADAIMPAVQLRVAKEALRCLHDYAAANQNRYPWAASFTQAAGSGSYFTDFQDSLAPGPPALPPQGLRFGHLADGGASQFPFTQWSSQQIGLLPQMSTAWAPACSLSGTWWMNWKAVVYYGVATGYAPDATTLGCTGSNCLTVDPPAATNNKKVVVIVAGRALGGQDRTPGLNLNDVTNYLEGSNTSNPTFQADRANASFNDVVVYE